MYISFFWRQNLNIFSSEKSNFIFWEGRYIAFDVFFLFVSQWRKIFHSCVFFLAKVYEVYVFLLRKFVQYYVVHVCMLP